MSRVASEPGTPGPRAPASGRLIVNTIDCAARGTENLGAWKSETDSVTASQGNSDVAQQIKQLQQDSRNAQMKNDVSWAQQHLADGFTAGNSWGAWETKDDFMKDLQNKTNKWKSGDISDVQVATFGPNTAVSHYTFTYDAELNGTHRARTVICSDTWVNDSGTWKTASTHCSMVKGK
jgi:Domain of unknown function (DUF4440)